MLKALVITGQNRAGWTATIAIYRDYQHLCDVHLPDTYFSEPEAYSAGRASLAEINKEEICILEAKLWKLPISETTHSQNHTARST